MGLIQSHLAYGAPIWGLAKTTKLEPLRIAQKRAIRQIHSLTRRAHTHKYFLLSRILKLDDLIQYITLTYIQGSIHETSPENIKLLWKVKTKNPTLRDRGTKLDMHRSNKQWFIDLPNNKQTQIWDKCPIDTDLKPTLFKVRLKRFLFLKYGQTENDNSNTGTLPFNNNNIPATTTPSKL